MRDGTEPEAAPAISIVVLSETFLAATLTAPDSQGRRVRRPDDVAVNQRITQRRDPAGSLAAGRLVMSTFGRSSRTIPDKERIMNLTTKAAGVGFAVARYVGSA